MNFLRSGTIPPAQLLSAIAPNFWGTPLVAQSEWGPINYAESTVYAGFFPLLLALTAPLWRREPVIWFAWAMLALSVGMVIGSPTLYLFAILPGFNVLAHARMIYIVCFCVALLCGLVLERVFASPRRWLPLVVIGGLAIAGRGLLHLAIGHYADRVPEVVTPLQADARWLTVQVGLGLACLSLLLPRWQAARALGCAALIGLIVIDMARFSLPYNAGTRREDQIYPQPAVLRALPSAAPPFRIAAVQHDDLMFLPNSLMALGIPEVGGYSSLVPRSFRDFILALDPEAADSYVAEQTNMVMLNSFTAPLDELLGAAYIVSAQPIDAPDHLELVSADEGLFLYRDRSPTPRAYIVAGVRRVPDLAAALKVLSTPGYTACSFATVRLPDTVVLPSGDGCIGSAAIVDYQLNSVRVEASAPSPGLLVFSDAFAPGWTALVNGIEQPIYEANAIFRGVVLPAGTHTVEFVFRPRSVLVGAAVTLVSLVAAILLVATGVRRRSSTGARTANAATVDTRSAHLANP